MKLNLDSVGVGMLVKERIEAWKGVREQLRWVRDNVPGMKEKARELGGDETLSDEQVLIQTVAPGGEYPPVIAQSESFKVWRVLSSILDRVVVVTTVRGADALAVIDERGPEGASLLIETDQPHAGLKLGKLERLLEDTLGDETFRKAKGLESSRGNAAAKRKATLAAKEEEKRKADLELMLGLLKAQGTVQS